MTSPPDHAAELALLTRRLERERRARRTAEQVGERSTKQLYETIQELQQARDSLRQHLEDQTLVHQLSRRVRQDLDPRGIVLRAVTSVGAAVGADRCLVRLADGSGIGTIVEQWTADGVRRLPDDAVLPPALAGLCLAAAERRESLRIDDVGADPRLPARDAPAVATTLGASSYLGTPMWMGTHLVGWLVLHRTTTPGPWTARQLAVVEGVAGDLGTALMQARAHAQQAEALMRLEQVDRVKSEFVSTVSHELRTPLTSIRGYLEVLVDEDLGELNEHQHQTLSVVSRNTGRLLTLIEDLLSLSRADAGAGSADAEPVDLAVVLAQAHQAMQPLVVRRNLRLDLVVGDVATLVLGDHDQLERVVINLLSNAVKFTPDGGAVTATLTAEGTRAVLVVSDTGIGIPEDDVPHVFDRFYRSSVAGERAVQGTGLGLAVVKSIVEQHGGTIGLSSVPTEGTAVTVSLPLTGSEASVLGPDDGGALLPGLR